MAKQLSRKVRLLSYAFIVLAIGAVTGWFGSPTGSTPRALADVPTPTNWGDSPGACPSSPADCCD